MNKLPESYKDWPLEAKIKLLEQLKQKTKEQEQTKGSPDYESFKRRYYDDPVAFATDCIMWRAQEQLAEYQREIMRAVIEQDRLAIRSPHGVGKTATVAIIILWFALTRDGEDWKIPTTASVWRQLSKFLWPEIKKWSRRLNWTRIGRKPFSERFELMTMNLRLKTGESFALASDDPEALEGAHADHILYVFDEAKSIPDGVWNSAEGALTSGKSKSIIKPTEAKAIAISTPGDPEGRFYEIHQRRAGFEDWWVRHITRTEAISAGRMDEEWATQRMLQWGEDSSVYKNRVLGEFAEAGVEGLIPLSWIEAAIDRWSVWKEDNVGGIMTCLGADIGGGGDESDQTVIARVVNNVTVSELIKMPFADPMTATMVVTGRIASMLPDYNTLAIIDVTGIGAGVLHRLREMRLTAWGFSAARKTELRDKAGELGFINQRAAAWWITRELFDPANEIPIAIPPDDELIGDLTAPKWKIHSNGKIQIEAKDSIRRRLHRSTDCGDAVVMALVGPILMDEEREQETEVYEDMSVEIGDY
jgi:hypothetical protein